jgi:hypothetical protein
MTRSSSTSSVNDRPDERDPAEPAVRGEDYLLDGDLAYPVPLGGTVGPTARLDNRPQAADGQEAAS